MKCRGFLRYPNPIKITPPGTSFLLLSIDLGYSSIEKLGDCPPNLWLGLLLTLERRNSNFEWRQTDKTRLWTTKSSLLYPNSTSKTWVIVTSLKAKVRLNCELLIYSSGLIVEVVGRDFSSPVSPASISASTRAAPFSSVCSEVSIVHSASSSAEV